MSGNFKFKVQDWEIWKTNRTFWKKATFRVQLKPVTPFEANSNVICVFCLFVCLSVCHVRQNKDVFRYGRNTRFWLMFGSCHLDRSSNDKIRFEFWIFRVVVFLKFNTNSIKWSWGPLKSPSKLWIQKMRYGEVFRPFLKRSLVSIT